MRNPTLAALTVLVALAACQPADQMPRTGGGRDGRVIPVLPPVPPPVMPPVLPVETANEATGSASVRAEMPESQAVKETQAVTETQADTPSPQSTGDGGNGSTGEDLTEEDDTGGDRRETARRAPAVDPDPARFAAASPETVRQRLGAPDWRRREGDARLWQFRAAHCVLDVVFYPDGGTLTAAHLEARDRNGAALPPSACLKPLLERHRDRPAATG